LEYQWQKDGEDLMDATEESLTLQSTSESDTGAYTVVVRDAENNTCSASATLTVTENLPGPGGLALAVLVGLCGLGGFAVMRRK
jgi:hypothetical protein